MQKIVIENFMAIPYAEIEVNKVLVLIGEQASGKSTIAKLIYFFKSLRDEVFNLIYDTTLESSDIEKNLFSFIFPKFYSFFGSLQRLSKFKITYFYSLDKYITLSWNGKNSLRKTFSNDFLNDDLILEIKELSKLLQVTTHNGNIHRQIAFEQLKFDKIKKLSSFVNNTFECYHNSPLYVIAGRNATISYSSLFEKYLFANMQSRIEENKRKKTGKKKQTVDEILMLDFVEHADRMKDSFEKYNGFEGLLDFHSNSNHIQKDISTLVYNKIKKILKGDYKIDDQGEKIILSNGKYVHLNNASSGQQESIRILQDIFLSLIEQQKVFRIIEEPEAHLFPEAQKLMIELLAILVNADKDNQVIITTHSPYVLTVFNNLLFANRVIEKNPDTQDEVAKLIDSQSIIKADDFAAYSLNPSQTDENGESYCVNLVNEQTQVIDQNYLDIVSEELSSDFSALYDLHTKSFARR